MRKRLAHLPSPAMAVAFVAMLAALTGTAVALPGTNTVGQNDLVGNSVGKAEIKAGAVGKAEIRSGGVGGAEVINNSLGGADVNERSLRTVPSANQAGEARAATVANTAGRAGVANFAGNAGAVDGSSIANIDFRAAEETPNTVIFDQGGLRLVANCISDDLEINAVNTTSSVGSLYLEGIDPGDAPDYEEFDQFEPGVDNQVGTEFYPNDTDTNQTIYFSAAAGANVTAHLHYEENAQITPGQTGCAVTGYAVVS